MGTGRRVFLLDDYLDGPTMEGFAYRLNKLRTNPFLSAVLIATDGTDDSDTTLRMMNDIDPSYERPIGATDVPLPPAPNEWHTVARGYDPLNIPLDQAADTLQHVHDLTLAMRGEKNSKIPVVMVPHGIVADGGAAFLLSSYVLATYATTLEIHNPQRGLSLDPTGLSFLLSRVGVEFDQPASQYSAGVALILALTGYTATPEDMMETGLATHYLGSPEGVPVLETNIIQIDAWKDQAIVKPPKRYDGPGQSTMMRSKDFDWNAQHRNVQVAEIVAAISEYSADGADFLDDGMDLDSETWDLIDPSIKDLEEGFPSFGDAVYRNSHLVNYAATFAEIFQKESSIVGVVNRLEQIANNALETQVLPEDQALAKSFCDGIEKASPLAIVCVDQLLRLGNGRMETLESCMARELKVQTKLLTTVIGVDYQKWRQNKGQAPPKWQYDSIADVPMAQVEEIIKG